MNVANLERSARIRLGMTGRVTEVRRDDAGLHMIDTDAGERFVARLNSRSEPVRSFGRMPKEEFPIRVWPTVGHAFTTGSTWCRAWRPGTCSTRCAPEEYRLEPYRRYSFGPFYTTEYMAEAVRAMLPELEKRDDLQPNWKREMDEMRSRFRTTFKEVHHDVDSVCSPARGDTGDDRRVLEDY